VSAWDIINAANYPSACSQKERKRRRKKRKEKEGKKGF
jgi:hypothetical protein